MLLPNKNTSKIALLILIGITLLVCKILGVMGNIPNYVQTIDLWQPGVSTEVLFDPCGLEVVECDDNLIEVKVTGFSSVECKTIWCKANTGLPRGQKVALNSKYGNINQVYIQKYDKTYDVIGTTDYKTDLDIWFGDDYQTALEQNTQYLKIKLIK